MSEGENDAACLTVLRAGVYTTIQDLGRFGYAHYGLSQGGAMDIHAHCWANKLVDNPVIKPTVEVTIGLASFRAESDIMLAITGADMQAELDGERLGNWRSFPMSRGQILKLNPARQGMRAYLGIKEGIQSPPVLGSGSTVIRNGIGSVISDGERLPVRGAKSVKIAHVPPRYLAQYPDTILLRVIESYQAADFSSGAMKDFYGSEYRLSQDCDRMGARLEGEPVVGPSKELISEGIALGAIQIPPDGQPIILLNDRQTLGGYPKLGCIARVDLPKLAQARPGTRIRFAPVLLDQAQQEWGEFCDYFSL